MEILGGMNLHLESSFYKILTHLQNAFFYFWSISCIDNVLSKCLIINNLCLFLIFQHLHSFVVTTEYIIDVNAYQYFDFFNIG